MRPPRRSRSIARTGEGIGIARDQGTIDQLKLSQVSAYGFGDVSLNLFYTGLNLYLLLYYTDVLGIAPATAGLIFMLPLFWDAVTDPVMGWLASRTRTRFGRYRPYLLFGAPLMSLGFVGMFAAPILFPGAVVISSAIAHLIFRTLYTTVSIPYAAMTAALTNDSTERGWLAGARMFAAIFGGLITAAVTWELAKSLGGDDLKYGFFLVSIIYAVLATTILTITFFTTKERVSLPDGHRHVSLAETVRFLTANKAFWILFIALILALIGSTIGNKAMLYYVSYYVGQPDAVSLALVVPLLVAGVSVPVWTLLSRYTSKRNVWLISAFGSAALNFTLYLMAPREMGFILIILGLNGLFVSAFVVTFWSMLPDTVEYGEWHSGVRDESMVFGLHQLAMKIASGVGVGLLGLALGAVGYEANVAQTPETLEGIRNLSFLVPMVAGLAGVAVIWFYPITGPVHAKLVSDIADRRAANDARFMEPT